MKVLRYFVGVLALLLSLTASRAQMIPDNVGQSSNGLPPALVNVGFDPQLNAQIPLDAAFTDEMGNPVRLRDYSGKKPIVLVFVYFNCPMLCSQVEQAVVGSLKMISFNPGTDYQVVFISFDPADTPDGALKKKHEAMSRFARPATQAGWHFLTGSKESIDAVTKAANFRFSYDQKSQIFAHASGILLSHAGWPHFPLLLRRGVSAEQRPPGACGCVRRENRDAGRSLSVVLLPV